MVPVFFDRGRGKTKVLDNTGLGHALADRVIRDTADGAHRLGRPQIRFTAQCGRLPIPYSPKRT